MMDNHMEVPGRIRSLDITRGVAVMGIFSVNVVAMAMIQIAYFYPPAYGFDTLADQLVWLGNFIFVDGKLRSLFSIMFGASTLLVIDRAIAAGRSPARAHYARMIVLMGFGLLHFLLLWWGDILTHYAAVGMVAFLFHRFRARTLFFVALAGFTLYAVPGVYFSLQKINRAEQVAAGTASPELQAKWEKSQANFFPDAATIARDRADHATIGSHVSAAWKEGIETPLDLGPLWIETLSLMLLGMAGYRSGFLTCAWSARRYRAVATVGIGAGIVGYSLLAAWAWRHGFRPEYAMSAYSTFSPPMRPVMASGYAALILLLARGAGGLSDRVAAVGRMAFSNYLGCTMLGVLVFYGFGGDLYARVSRAEAWLLVPPTWLLMLAWSKPWLDRFNYGPLEWLWRSLSRGRMQPMIRRPNAMAEPLPV